ncbi:DUF2007 domain-containing protein [Fulvivirga sp. M361]|uniref:putative signal transducing protein n=1 Tax=Fulvivirga sp. M361 TaxID=2594266 RepID=UPI00117B6EA5|nr:DUF2007 domain-containing protein [Fulvivirga sp. M361]TRX50946.1 DUF2007 domain-containing protein [Fulvivirga sp. M361]
MSKWHKVFSSYESYKAEIVKDLLEENGANPVIINKQDSSISSIGQGQYEVHVIADEVIRSLKIIENEVNFG